MIYHSNTQKPLQGGRSRLGSRDTQGASAWEEAKELSSEGSWPINCWVFIIIIIVFSNVAKPIMVFGKRWKFQMFVYNWLQGPQPHSEKFLSVIGLFPRLDTVQGLDSFIAKQGWQQAQLRLWAGLINEWVSLWNHRTVWGHGLYYSCKFLTHLRKP